MQIPILTPTTYCICTIRLEFLAEYTSIALSDMRLNSETFRWLERMPPILEEHREITGRSRREAEEALKVCNYIIIIANLSPS